MNYRIRVRRLDCEVEVESTEKDFVEDKFRELQEVTWQRIATPAQGSVSSALGATSTSKGTSLVEFKRLVNPQSGTENALTVAYFLEKIKGQPEFNSKELTEGLKDLKCNFKNYSDVILKARGIGFIMPGSASKTFRVTESGERWIEARLPNQANSNA